MPTRSKSTLHELFWFSFWPFTARCKLCGKATVVIGIFWEVADTRKNTGALSHSLYFRKKIFSVLLTFNHIVLILWNSFEKDVFISSCICTERPLFSELFLSKCSVIVNPSFKFSLMIMKTWLRIYCNCLSLDFVIKAYTIKKNWFAYENLEHLT